MLLRVGRPDAAEPWSGRAVNADLERGGSQVVGPKGVAQRYGRGYRWARELLKEWHAEDLRTGRSPPRTFRRRGHGGITTIYTTLAILNACMPPGRDERLVRQVAGVERDLDDLARKMVGLVDRCASLERRVADLERGRRR